jgi:predicted kinase
MKQTLYMTLGLQASGKTTLARQMVESSAGQLVRVNKDDIRERLRDGVNSWDEKLVVRERDVLIEEALSAGLSVISDDTNLNPVHEKRLRELAVKYHACFKVIDMRDTPFAVCLERNRQRENPLPDKVLYDTHARWMRNVSEYDHLRDANKPQAYIFDVDGTMARRGNRSWFDETRYYSDTVINPVVNIFRAIQKDYRCLVVSGREGKERAVKETLEWFKDIAQIEPDGFWMRKAGDMRSDCIVKREIYEQHIRPNFNVLGVFDDRTRVLNEWSRLGLFVFDVGNQVDF